MRIVRETENYYVILVCGELSDGRPCEYELYIPKSMSKEGAVRLIDFIVKAVVLR